MDGPWVPIGEEQPKVGESVEVAVREVRIAVWQGEEHGFRPGAVVREDVTHWRRRKPAFPDE